MTHTQGRCPYVANFFLGRTGVTRLSNILLRLTFIYEYHRILCTVLVSNIFQIVFPYQVSSFQTEPRIFHTNIPPSTTFLKSSVSLFMVNNVDFMSLPPSILSFSTSPFTGFKIYVRRVSDTNQQSLKTFTTEVLGKRTRWSRITILQEKVKSSLGTRVEIPPVFVIEGK